MKRYDVFRKMEDGGAALWMKATDDFESAKPEAMNLAAKTKSAYFVLNLSDKKILFETGNPEIPVTRLD